MRIVLVAALVLAGCVEGEPLDIPDHDGGWEADSFAPDSEIDAAEPEPDADIPDAEPPPPCNVFAWPDADGDGYGDENAEPVEACDEIPVGYVANADDCYDGNANAKPGQTAWFTVHRGDGSFDYDCDGAQEKRYNVMGSCPELHPDCPPMPQWPAGFECDYVELTTPGTRGWFRNCLSYFQRHGYWHCAEYEDVAIPDCGESAGFKNYEATCVGAPITRVQGCR